jgi:RNA polymerase sigma factor (sigma-70 family)
LNRRGHVNPRIPQRGPSVFDVLLKASRDRSFGGLADNKLVLMVSDTTMRRPVQKELLCRHAYMLKSISGRMHARATGGAELCDYEAQAILGAYVSYDRYEVSKGVRLATYTYSTVVRHIQDAQRREPFEQGTRLPPSLLKHRSYLLGDYDPYPDFKRAYEDKNGLTPEVIRALQSHELFGLIHGVESSDALYVTDFYGHKTYLVETVPDSGAPTEDEIVDMAMLSSAVNALGSDKDRSVAQMVLLERRTVDEVAGTTGLSAPQVRRSLYRSSKRLGKMVSGGTDRGSNHGTAPKDTKSM